ncbi:MAG: UvrD-helicase domain-containing protein [Coriobacteriales bacterium]|jgi:DNA helicase-2/ATP-dependent DNA helicase PcrA|nr:UvrD-helicase domain-containing protein [Coriobacteriales bacterium]
MPIELSQLNPAQHEAVLATEGPLLVLAGAGSGKTRVLAYRIAHLVEDLGVSPYQILAITFTNKAAAEMRERLSHLLRDGIRGMWVATFHAMCVRLLRQDADRLGFTRNFTIYDDDDSRRLMKTICNDLNIDIRQYPLNTLRGRISKAKNELVTAQDFATQANNGYEKLVARVYGELQSRLLRSDAMDFDDLLVHAWQLLAHNPELLASYQNRFRYLHIDEYQDTNHAQYSITKLLAQATRNIMVVGDDDQSIYSWRGADIRNILEFEHDYPEAVVIKLEQNYRSTSNILKAANAVIANNVNRKRKRLFTEGAEGEKLAVYQASDERDEGRWIAAEVEKLHRRGRPYRDFAVFYRTNAQSRMLEDMLLRAGVPYRIVGGTRFFDRAEIRDVMAYLKLALNPADDIAAKRIINVPKRGIGKTSVEKIEALSHSQNCPFLEAAELALLEESFGTKAQTALVQFIQLFKDAQAYSGTLREVVELIVAKSGLIEALEAEQNDEAKGRIENIHEFFGVAQEFDETHSGEPEDEDGDSGFANSLDGAVESETNEREPLTNSVTSPVDIYEASNGEPSSELPDQGQLADTSISAQTQLPAFMEWLALRSDLDTLIAGDDYLTLMTIHSAKGLEFPLVFIAGLEEGIFPHVASAEDAGGLEEERRLAYVALTRAREQLFLTHAQIRKLYGNTQVNPRSRFVMEIPQELLVTSGVGSRDYRGTALEKRGDRRGIYGSGSSSHEHSGGHVFGKPADTGEAALREERKAVVFSKGDEVDHKTFGRGTIIAIEGDALLIRFSKSGETKKLLKGFAPLVKIG